MIQRTLKDLKLEKYSKYSYIIIIEIIIIDYRIIMFLHRYFSFHRHILSNISMHILKMQ
jgi:hypothetical protein